MLGLNTFIGEIAFVHMSFLCYLTKQVLKNCFYSFFTTSSKELAYILCEYLKFPLFISLE